MIPANGYGFGKMPQKTAWEARKKGGVGFKLLNECSTLGKLPTFFESLSDKKLAKYGSGITILCIASPTTNHAITCAVVYRDSAGRD